MCAEGLLFSSQAAIASKDLRGLQLNSYSRKGNGNRKGKGKREGKGKEGKGKGKGERRKEGEEKGRDEPFQC